MAFFCNFDVPEAFGFVVAKKGGPRSGSFKGERLFPNLKQGIMVYTVRGLQEGAVFFLNGGANFSRIELFFLAAPLTYFWKNSLPWPPPKNQGAGEKYNGTLLARGMLTLSNGGGQNFFWIGPPTFFFFRIFKKPLKGRFENFSQNGGPKQSYNHGLWGGGEHGEN